MKWMTRLAAGILVMGVSVARAAETYRLYDGITAFVNNPEGRDFTLTLELRDINHRMHGPSELLLKVYPPDGKPVVREIIDDDGVVVPTAGPPAAGWDHEAWYYATCYSRGLEPGVQWSAFSDPARLAAMPSRTITRQIPGGQKGVYRVLLVGSPDIYATLQIDPALKYGVAGSPEWLHGHGEQYRKAYVYVPRTTCAINVHFIQFDEPATRTFTVKDASGTVLAVGDGANGLNQLLIDCTPPEKSPAAATESAQELAAFAGTLDGQVLLVEVSDGPGDFLLNVTCQIQNSFVPIRAKTQAVTAILCPDPETAQAANGGAIYHDGEVFWQMNQVRLHEWLKQIKPEDFIFDASKVKREGFYSVGSHNAPSFGGGARKQRPHAISDLIMHNWAERQDPNELNAAIRDMLFGMRLIGPGDHVAIGPNRNLAYEGGSYTFFWHRPAWRIIQHSSAPQEVKDILKEFIIQTGDRLAFCRTVVTGNGNAFGSLMEALRYCYEASGDALQKQTFETCWDRFLHGGYGERHGIGPSGGLQESNGYDYHYGSYVLRGWNAVIADLKDQRFIDARNRMFELYSYIYFQGTGGNPWSSRTSNTTPAGGTYDPWGPFRWKGVGGPDLTVSVNDANEWFAARRAGYYMVTYHGRLTPTWECEGFHGQIGLGGGTICQLHIPGKGQVISGAPSASYGRGMHLSQWRDFHIHGLVGTTSDGLPLVAANSEHFNARLDGTVVTSSGSVRQSSVEVSRRYDYGPTAIRCEVALQESHHDNVFGLWGGRPSLRGKVTEAYEMLPFVDAPAQQGKRRGARTTVTLLGADNRPLGVLDDASVGKPACEATAVLIDVGGYGALIQFDDPPRSVQRGRNDTILVTLADRLTPAGSVRFAYTIVPFTGIPPEIGQLAGGKRQPLPVAALGTVDDVGQVAALLAEIEPVALMQNQAQAGWVRFAIAGDRLALQAVVSERQIERPDVVWRGSCLEVFGSMPGTATIGQVFLVPALGDKPAAAQAAQGGKQVPADDIRVISHAREDGYELVALIPLSRLKIDMTKESFLLEFQADLVLSGKARAAVTAFGSVHAYENNQRYGLFLLPLSGAF